MDHRKLDAGLAAALADERRPEARLRVLVRLRRPVAEREQPLLDALGLGPADATVVTATLSPLEVDRASELASVHHIELARRLDLLGPGPGVVGAPDPP